MTAADQQRHRHAHGHSHDGTNGEHEPPSAVRGFLRGVLRPHSHDSVDSVDSVLESSRQGVRAVKTSLVALMVTALVQLAVVWVTGSVALLADTVHNFSDALTALPLWVAFALARRSPTRRYTYGYGRAEDLAGMFIVAMIALSAVVAGVESVRRLVDPAPVDRVPVLIAAGLVGFLGNELVAAYRLNVGRQIGSAALVADGLHARTDGFTSLAVVLGAVGVLAGYPIADPIVGLLITAAILVVLKGAATEVYRRLMDAVDPALVDRAEEALRAVTGVEDVGDLRVRWLGHRLRAEADITVHHALSVSEGHAIAVEAQHQLIHQVPRLAGATVHVNPTGTGDIDPHDPLAHHQL